ncbi:putative Ig domain-containing protein [Streptomyces sp. TLI_146]|uniref:putative Ig domain-containing protein n=1 Tax=Streptomyces sp. TLI_146 TaxID=1938858 RepID=UPI000CB23DD7|nr:putative Ig domain-containing protein [Streptomyces sp. TLI_146]PKV90062.1 putative Ig domain-containing protein [Streptomyces sp. TLI_146]
MRHKFLSALPARAGLLLAALLSTGLAVLPAGQVLAQTNAPGEQAKRACNDLRPHHANCLAIGFNSPPGGTAAPSGYGPADIKSAYSLPSGGSGVTVAIVDAFDNPNAEKDLATYRSNYGLPACTTANGCFKKVNQRGGTSYPRGDTGWGVEIALDLDAVSAACPACNILLVEADDNNDANLYAADDTAARLGAKFVSNSWTTSESSGQTSDDAHFNVPGVLFAFATGDSGYGGGTQYPASSSYALAVGGTSLSRNSSGRGWGETVWSGAGSGCSAYGVQPAWQKGVGTGCSKKANSDVSAVADPQTGLAIYDTYGQSGWLKYGGTSLSTPLITAMYALAGTPGAQDNPVSYPYAHTSALYDVTSGSNGSCGTQICNARSGWDGPTGLGTPNGVSAFTPGGTTPPSGVSVANPGDQTGTVGTPVSLKNSASGGSAPYTWSATGLPAGLSIDSATGTVTGTPSTAGTFRPTLTAKDTTGATGSTSFTWTINGGGQGGTVTVTNPGNQIGFTGFEILPLTVKATDSKGLPLTFTATSLPPGLSISGGGTITGTPSKIGTYSVTVKATDTGGATGTTSFSWTVYQGF